MGHRSGYRGWDWNSLLSDPPGLPFRNYSSEYFPHADDMLRYLTDFHRAYALNVRFDTWSIIQKSTIEWRVDDLSDGHLAVFT